MDLNQLLVALIGASSTLLAALLGSRSRQKPGTIPSRRSFRKRLIKFGIYFLLGGVATYWVMSWLFPFAHIDERLRPFGMSTSQFTRPNVAFAKDMDSTASPSLPVGSVILSVLPPGQLDRLPGGSRFWAPADGRMLDSSSSYAVLTGSARVPDMRGVSLCRPKADSSPGDSVSHDPRPPANSGERIDSTFHWYVRIN